MSRRVSVDAEVDLSDIDTDDLMEELRDRDLPQMAPPSRQQIERLYYATRSGEIPPPLTREVVDLLADLYGRAA